jgi:hypothetical protein
MQSPLGFVVLVAGLPLLAACAQKQAPVVAAIPPPQTAPSSPAITPSHPLTAAELDQARQQLAGCWYLNPQKTPAPIPTVEIKVELLPDGTVSSAQVENPDRMQTDPAFRDAAEAALRAVRKCSPLKLPPDKYLAWKSTIFRFSASGVVG